MVRSSVTDVYKMLEFGELTSAPELGQVIATVSEKFGDHLAPSKNDV